MIQSLPLAVAHKALVAGGAERPEEKAEESQQNPAPDPCALNGALPMQAGVQPASVAPNPASLNPASAVPAPVNSNQVAASVNNHANALIAANVNLNNNIQLPNVLLALDVPTRLELDVSTFNGANWLASTIGDVRSFAAVCLNAFKKERKRSGAARLSTIIPTKGPTIDKCLRFITCLVKN